MAYDRAVKFDLLDVTPGPVVTSEAAAQMATAVRRLLGADIGIATTGEAGPELPNWRYPSYAGGQGSTYTEWRLGECGQK